jgi:VCBS repeat-containing protein
VRLPFLSFLSAAVVAFGLAAAPAGAATTQQDAQVKALNALRVHEGTAALVVFKLGRPVPAGTAISAAGRFGGPASATASAKRTAAARLREAGVTVAGAPRVARVGDEPAWFFYEDQAPYQSYAHAGRVVLVGTQTGKVTVTTTLQWPPLIDGRLPAFLRSAAAYRDARYSAFDRAWTSVSSAAGTATPGTATGPSPLESATARKQAADALAAERSCAVRISDTLGDFYDAAAVDQSRARIGVLMNALARLNPGFVSTRYRFATVRGGESLKSFISRLVAKRGCKDLMLYVAGGGYVARGESIINVGTRVRPDGRLEQQTVTASGLRAILRAHPGVTFKIVLDAPYSGGFGTALSDAPNLLVFLSSASATQGSFTALPSVVDPDGRPVPNTFNKAQLLEFSNRELTGLYCFVDSPAEVAAAIRAQAAGTSKSFMAWMLARAFSLCSAGNVVQAIEGAPQPVITQVGFKVDPLLAAPGTPALPGVTPMPTVPAVTPIDPGGLAPTDVLAPTVALTAGTISYTENDPATVIDAGLTVTDADSTSLSSASAQIATGYVSGQDVLELASAAPAGISSAFDTATGTLTLSGTASIADYQSALRKVAYRNSSDAPSTAARSVRFVATDAAGTASTAVARNVAVAAVNDGPSASDDAYGVAANATLTVAAGTGVLANDTDADGDTLTVDQVAGSGANVGTSHTTTGGAHVTVNTNGSLSYDPNGQFDGLSAGQTATDTVTYRATDGSLDDTATITVTITGANDAPVAVDDAYTTTQNGVLTVAAGTGVLANDTDADGDTLTVDQVSGSAGNVGTAFTTTGGAQVTVDADGSLGYDPGHAFDSLTAGQTADDTFTYRVADGNGGTDTATVTVTVLGATDAPVATDDSYTTGEDTPLTVSAPGVLANDTDADGETLSVDQVAGSGANVATSYTTTGGAHVTVNANGSLTYDPNGQFEDLGAGQTATDTVSYRATDGGLDDTATITFTITGVNDAPTATDDSYSVGEDGTLTVNAATGALANDTDPEGDTLTVDQVNGSGSNVATVVTTVAGTHVTVNANGSLTYDPNGQFNALGTGDSATDTFTYRAADGNGGTDTATVTVTINGVNDAPTATDDGYTTDEDTLLTVAAPAVLANDSDPDLDPLAVDQVDGSAGNVATNLTSAGGATVRINANGSLSYDPRGHFDSLTGSQQTTDTVTYRVSDGNGGTDTATVTVTITGVEDAPVAGDDSYSGVGNTTLVVGNTIPAGRAGKSLTGSIEDNDVDPDTPAGNLSITAGTRATTLGGSATVDADGTFTYTPPTSTTSASDTFTYTVTDGTASDTGTVTIALSGRVWYVDNTATAGGTGRSSDPFDTLAEGTSAAGSGGTVYVHQGSGTTGQNAGATLAANERLLGAGVDLVVGGDTLYDGSIAQRPSIGNAGGAGVTLASGSTVQGLAISGTGGAAISGGSGVAGSTIADVALAGNAGGLSLTSTSGTFTISDTTISTSGGTGLTATSAGTVNFTSAGTISVTTSGARALIITGTALSGTIDGATTTGSATGGVTLQNTTGSIALGGLSLAATGGTGFLADNVAGLSIPSAGTANVSNSGGTAVAVRNSSGPNATFDTVSGTASGTTAVDVSGNGGGGTTTFSGAVTATTGSATGVSLTNNTGHAIAFTGGNVAITTTSGRGFDATGGGTVTAQGTGSTISSTTGTALRIANTTIGAANATFQSISNNGAANGIVLDTTGSSGGLVVTGTGGAGSGGTIQNTAGADGSTQGIGVYLNATSGTSLSSINLSNHQGFAVRGTTVSNVSLSGLAISGSNGTSDAADEASVAFNQLTGTSTITNTSVSGGVEDNVRVYNTSGTMNLTLDGNTIGANNASTGGNGMLVEGHNTANETLTVKNTNFTSSREDLFQATVTDQATSDVTFDNNTLANGQAAKVSGGSGISLNTAGNGSGANLTYRIRNNTINGNDNAIFVQKAPGIATVRGRIEGNLVGTAGVTGSGANAGSGITVETRGQGSHIARISGNTVRQHNQDGIASISGEKGVNDNGNVNLQLTVVNNTVTEPKRPQTLTGLRSEMADPAATVDECLDVQGNQFTGGGPLGGDIRILHDFSQNTVRLPGYSGSAQDGIAVENYLAARNTASTVNAFPPGSGPGFVNGGAGCTQPPA